VNRRQLLGHTLRASAGLACVPPTYLKTSALFGQELEKRAAAPMMRPQSIHLSGLSKRNSRQASCALEAFGDDLLTASAMSTVVHMGRLYAGTGTWDWERSNVGRAGQNRVYIYEGENRDCGRVGKWLLRHVPRLIQRESIRLR
jgi:hypothetical protein